MLKQAEIIRIGRESGLDLIGLFKTDPLDECFMRLKDRFVKGQVTGFEGEIPENRINYHYFYPPVKTGIAIGVNYFHPLKRPKNNRECGEIASVARGLDYHLVLRYKADELMKKLNKHCHKLNLEEIKYKVFVDNSGLIDRGSAYRAGFGFFGKNNCLINKDYGSYFFIGQILINQTISFEKNQVEAAGCGSCRLCIEACPTGALQDSFHFDPQKCISYLTQKKTLSKEEEKTFTQYLYGCDICQKVCPYNQKLKKTGQPAFQISQDKAYPNLKTLIEMSNAAFKKEFSTTALAWRGKKNLIRNAKLIMKNRSKVI